MHAPHGGCGSDEDTPASEAKQDGKTSAYPVTIAQKLGEVTIDAEPQRVVALDFPSADNTIALGVVPIGMAEVSYVEGGFPFETIAKLAPDAKRVTACAGSPPDTQKIGFAQL